MEEHGKMASELCVGMNVEAINHDFIGCVQGLR
jgi:hypothetical protein